MCLMVVEQEQVDDNFALNNVTVAFNERVRKSNRFARKADCAMFVTCIFVPPQIFHTLFQRDNQWEE